MFVCICKGITEKNMKEALAAGRCLTLRDFQQSCGVGTQCGRCVSHAKQVLGENHSQLQTCSQVSIYRPASDSIPKQAIPQHSHKLANLSSHVLEHSKRTFQLVQPLPMPI